MSQDILNSSFCLKFDLRNHPIALELSPNSSVQSSLCIFPSMISVHNAIICAICSRYVYETCSSIFNRISTC